MPVADPPLILRISLWFRNLGNSSPNARNPPYAKQSIFEVLAVICKQLDDFDRTCPGSTIKTLHVLAAALPLLIDTNTMLVTK